MEIWKPIPGFDGRYEVSTQGRVRSVGVGRWKNRSSLLATPPGNHGYPVVNIAAEGQKPRPELVHRLVALTFIGPCPEGMQVRHGDGVRVNVTLSNLSYGTQRDNEEDKKRHGTARPSDCYLAVLDQKIVGAIRGAGPLATVSDAELGRRIGVTPATICDIRKKRSWKEVAPLPRQRSLSILRKYIEV